MTQSKMTLKDTQPLYSRLMLGWVRHRRFSPKQHNLKYPIFMLYLDLDELNVISRISRLLSVEKTNWLSFFRGDYFGHEQESLKQAVIGKIAEQGDVSADAIHRVTMLTNLRTLGFVMNPVTFYYAFDQNDKLLSIMPEITNTPWRERHQYVLTTDRLSKSQALVSEIKGRFRFNLSKAFHVSPFHPMSVQYDWRFSDPTLKTNFVHLENWESGTKVFDATMALNPEPLNAMNIRKTLIRFPWMTVKIATGIYVNALKLWLKGVPFYAHPNKSNKEKTI